MKANDAELLNSIGSELESTVSILGGLISKWQDRFNGKSSTWQDSANGQAFQERIATLGNISGNIENAVGDLISLEKLVRLKKLDR